MFADNFRRRSLVFCLSLLLCCCISGQAQQTGAASSVPPADSAVTNNASKLNADQGTKPDVDKSHTPTQPGKKDTADLHRPDTLKIPARKDELYEDWSKPELPPGMRTEADSLGVIKQPTFTRELVHVQWRELDPIDLTVVRPAGVEKPPVIVYLYSFPSSMDRYQDAKFCQFLTRNGFAAVGFAPALTGQRFHDRATAQWFVSQLQESLGTSVHDVQLVLNYLASRGDFDMTRVGMWGDGVGASIGIMAAAVDPRIKTLDLLDPWGDWPDWLAKSSIVPEKERPTYLKPEFLKSVKDLDPVKWLPKLKTQEVRLQYITTGLTVTPPAVRERLEAVAPSNVKIVHYEDAAAFRREVVSAGISFDWVKDHLRNPAATPQSEAQKMKNDAQPATTADQ